MNMIVRNDAGTPAVTAGGSEFINVAGAAVADNAILVFTRASGL